MPSRLEGQIQRLLDLFDETGIKVTCFILGWAARHQPQIVREIQRRGHEIASHGLNHDWVYNMDRVRFRQETEMAGKLLEDLTGKPLRGYRASNFSISRTTLWALEILAELGYEYDSSIYPIARRRYGMPGFPLHPVQLALPNGLSIIEFPPASLGWGRLRIPTAGGGFLRFWPYFLTDWTFRQNQHHQRPTVVYIHPWEIDPGQPRVKAGGRIKSWMHYCNLGQTFKRLRRMIEDYEFITMGEYIKREKYPTVKVLGERIIY